MAAEDLPQWLEFGQDDNIRPTFAQMSDMIQEHVDGYDEEGALAVMREAVWAEFTDGEGHQHRAVLGGAQKKVSATG